LFHSLFLNCQNYPMLFAFLNLNDCLTFISQRARFLLHFKNFLHYLIFIQNSSKKIMKENLFNDFDFFKQFFIIQNR